MRIPRTTVQNSTQMFSFCAELCEIARKLHGMRNCEQVQSTGVGNPTSKRTLKL